VKHSALSINTTNKPAMVCGAMLRATKLDWQLDCDATQGSYASPIEQSSEISQSSILGNFENSFTPGAGLG